MMPEGIDKTQSSDAKPIMMLWYTKILRPEPSRFWRFLRRTVVSVKRFSARFKPTLTGSVIMILRAVVTTLLGLPGAALLALVVGWRLLREIWHDSLARRRGYPNTIELGDKTYRRLPRGNYICPGSHLSPLPGPCSGTRLGICRCCKSTLGIVDDQVKIHPLPEPHIGFRAYHWRTH